MAVIDDRMSIFINSFDSALPDYLEEIKRKALEDNVPIVRDDMQTLLKFLMKERKPVDILEVGCAVGFSGLLMMEYAPENAHLTTIENYEVRIPIALSNFESAGEDKAERIELIEGDAADVLFGLEGEYDFIFLDAAKAQYINYLPDIMRLLKKGGMLVTDNVLQEGDILESRYAITRRDRTIHSRMREYLYEIKHREDLETVILPVGDGATLSVKL